MMRIAVLILRARTDADCK